MALFVTGTGTDVGKTIFSALFMARYGKELNIKYLKPVQTGADSDRDTVQKLSGLSDPHFLPGHYHFKLAASPHLAAGQEQSRIDTPGLEEQLKKHTGQNTIIELAGGLMVPLNREAYYTNLDLVRAVGFPCVLVAATGLGTINHTVLSWRALQEFGVDCRGIFFVGKTAETQNFASLLRTDNIRTIAEMTGAPILGDFMLPGETLSPEVFRDSARTFDREGKLRVILS